MKTRERHFGMNMPIPSTRAVVHELRRSIAEEHAERAQLIHKMLDDVYPFDESMPEGMLDQVDQDRQLLVLRTGWGDMPIDQLRRVAEGKQT